MDEVREHLIREIADILVNMTETELFKALTTLRRMQTNVEGSDEERHRQILKHLHEGPVVKLGISPIHGVGVFAVTDILAGVDPFEAACRSGWSRETDDDYEVVSEEELSEVPAVGYFPFHSCPTLHQEVRNLCLSFFAPFAEGNYNAEGGRTYPVNATGLNTLDISWYLNHSEVASNVELIEPQAPGEFNTYRTRRKIKQGEELTVDYRQLGEAYYSQLASGDAE